MKSLHLKTISQQTCYKLLVNLAQHRRVELLQNDRCFRVSPADSLFETYAIHRNYYFCLVFKYHKLHFNHKRYEAHIDDCTFSCLIHCMHWVHFASQLFRRKPHSEQPCNVIAFSNAPDELRHKNYIHSTYML